jgi:hypothetical protein
MNSGSAERSLTMTDGSSTPLWRTWIRFLSTPMSSSADAVEDEIVINGTRRYTIGIILDSTNRPTAATGGENR